MPDSGETRTQTAAASPSYPQDDCDDEERDQQQQEAEEKRQSAGSSEKATSPPKKPPDAGEDLAEPVFEPAPGPLIVAV